MGFDLDWQVCDDDDRWERIAALPRRRSLTMPRWLWPSAALLLLALVAAACLLTFRSYARARRQIAFQIQCVMDLVARALAQGDIDLYLAQQDPSSPAWYARPVRAARLLHRSVGPSEQANAQVEDVALHGDIATVRVLAGQGLLRQVRFYRRTERGWLHTAPQIAFWQDPLERTSDRLTIRFYERDQPYIEPLARHLTRVLQEMCTFLDCSPATPWQIGFSPALPPDGPPALSDAGLTFPSPWLSGIPVDGQWDDGYLSDLTYWVAHQVAAQAVRLPSDGATAAQVPLTRLQAALADEFALWYAQGNVAQTPLLRRVIEQNGAQALPEVLRSATNTPSLSAFMARWLALPARGAEAATFQTLLDIERESLYAGRRETFLLLQDEDPHWFERYTTTLFDLAQQDRLLFLRPQARVLDVRRAGDHALVRSQEAPNIQGTGLASPVISHTDSFRLQNGDWKHTGCLQPMNSQALALVLGPAPWPDVDLSQ